MFLWALHGSRGHLHIVLLPASTCTETKFSEMKIFSWPLILLALSFKVPKKENDSDGPVMVIAYLNEIGTNEVLILHSLLRQGFN